MFLKLSCGMTVTASGFFISLPSFAKILLKETPAEIVRPSSNLIRSLIEFVLDCMRENTTKVRNIKQYLKAVLFNAPSTIDSYYTALVNHDLYGGE